MFKRAAVGVAPSLFQGFWRFGPGGFQKVAGLAGSGNEVFEMSWVGPGRVGSGKELFEISQVRSGRVGSGRVGPEGFKSHGWVRATLTRSDPRDVIRPVKCP